ncbi:MAG: hypothetical protein ACK4GB_07255 [Tepidimonas sp.]
MAEQRRVSFEWRIILRVGAVMALVVSALLAVRLIDQHMAMLADRQQGVLLKTRSHAQEVAQVFEAAAAAARSAAGALYVMRREGRPDRKHANDIVRGTLEANPLVLGVSTA